MIVADVLVVVLGGGAGVYGNVDIISHDFFPPFPRGDTTHYAPCDLLYPVPMRLGR